MGAKAGTDSSAGIPTETTAKPIDADTRETIRKGYRLDAIDIVLGECNEQIRSSVRTGLRAVGVRNPYNFQTVANIEKALVLDPYDLLISDVDLPDGGFCDLCRRIRDERTPIDPFLPIIVYGEVRADRVRTVLDSGVDHILTKPISIHALMERIYWLVERRKGFVVTTTYVGPDRRRTPRGDYPLIEAPNPIRAKATGEWAAARTDLRRDAKRDVNTRRVRAQADALVNGAADLQRLLDAGETEPLTRTAEYLAESIRDICQRVQNTDYPHTLALCRNLLSVAESIVAATDTLSRDVAVFTPLAEAIAASFNDDTETAEAAMKIAGLVDEKKDQHKL